MARRSLTLDESLEWEDFFDTSVEIASTLVDMYDSMVAKSKSIEPTKRLRDHKRPLSISSMSSSSSSSTCSRHKKSYLASIESLEDEEERPWDPGLSLTERVVLEIIDTERTYVRDLHQTIEGYLHHLVKNSSLVEPQTFSYLFSNIEAIWKFNSLFLAELEKCGLDPEAVAKCFVKNGMGFEIYTDYCTNYPRTVSILTELMRNQPTAEIFKERQTSLRHSLPLGSYLLKPVQRILKYHLLLQNLAKHHGDKEGSVEIKNALSVMTGIAYHINAMKRKHEHAVRVQEIQSLLYGWDGQDLTTYGELVAEGMFRMYRAKTHRHLFLFDKILMIAKKKEEGMLNYKTSILCSNLMLIESIQGEPLCFHVIPFDNPKLQFTFQTRNLSQKREWCLQLKRVILENYNAVIPSHARQLVMELGQSRQDVNGGEKLSRRHLLAPEYLERRKQERRKSETPTRGFKLKRGLRKTSHSDSSKDSPSQDRRKSDSHEKSSENNNWNDSPIPNSFYNFQSLRKRLENTTSSPNWSQGYEETTDTESEDMLERIAVQRILEYRPSIKSCDSRASDGSLDPMGDYVTFLFAHTYACRDMEIDPLEEDKSKKKAIPHTSDETSSSTEKVPSCNNLFNIEPKKECDLDSSNSSWNLETSVRRAQSFSELDKMATMDYNKMENQQKPELPVKTLPLLLPQQSDLPLNPEDLSPTAPAKWLTQQQEHLATSVNKCGSLPRSFQIGANEVDYPNYRMRPRNGTRSQLTEQRPHTIASDTPEQKEYFVDKSENHFCNLERSPTEPLPLPSNEESNENVSSIHPEHKIYANAKYLALKNVFHNMGSKLAGFKASFSPTEENSLKIDRSESHCSIKMDKEIGPKLITSKLVNSVSKAYASMVKHKSKKNDKVLDLFALSQPNKITHHHPGSHAIGARMASPYESEYCVPKNLISTCVVRKAKEEEEETRPDSLFSESSNGSSSSDADQRNLEPPLLDPGDEEDDTQSETSVASADSYYERAFEAIENVLNDDLFRDSAIYSDPEDADLSTTAEVELFDDVLKLPEMQEFPPTLPLKISNKSLYERLRILENNFNGNVWEFRIEEESETGSDHSTSTVKESSRPTSPQMMQTKGWVKHVVNKLQAQS